MPLVKNLPLTSLRDLEMVGSNPIYYWDTCIFLSWLKNEKDRKPGDMSGVFDCLNRFKRRELSLMTSVLTLTEITIAKIPAGTETLLESAMQRPNFSKISVDLKIARLARDLRNYYLEKQEHAGKTLSVPDAIHLASAILYRANEFHTFDGKDGTRDKTLGLLPLSGNVGGHNLIICKPPEASGTLSLFVQ
jgi:predicted nucleic acid-binding protein